MDIASIRKEYKLKQLDEHDMAVLPVSQFSAWFSEAINAEVPEVNAMTLSTVNNAGKPSSRIVLVKDFNNSGFTFFTNYNSRKGSQIESNSFASLNFFWPQLERQVRIEGSVEKVDEQESLNYFNSRPWDSRVGAWVSNQSAEIASREELQSLFKNLNEKFLKEGNVPKPPHWGGYRLKPVFFEFWQGRPSRLHDRICYEWTGQSWRIFRLAP